MDPFVLKLYNDYLYSKNKPKEREYHASVDLWGIGCTLFEIACNRHPFIVENVTKESEARVRLYDLMSKEKGIIMGTNSNNEIELSNDFRRASPIFQECSEVLRTLYKDVILTCFTMNLTDDKIDKFFEAVNKVKAVKLCYKVSINSGEGLFDAANSQTGSTNVFEIPCITRISQQKRPQLPLMFGFVSTENISIKKPDWLIIGKDTNVITTRDEIVSACKSIRSMVSILEKSYFDVDMLTNLASILKADYTFNEFEKITDTYKEIRNKYREIRGIYGDINSSEFYSFKTVLTQLAKCCDGVKNDCRTRLIKYRQHVYGNKQFLISLCSDIAELLKKTSSSERRLTIWHY